MEDIKVADVIQPYYCKKKFEQSFYHCWREKKHFALSNLEENKDLKILSDPYNCAFMPNLLQDTNLLKEVSEELKTLDLQYKNNDLFKFKCTEDLKGVEKRPKIQELCRYIEGPIKDWIQKLTGLQLNKKVAISSSRYDYSDVLLCHDDELEGRRIAFILYLVPCWKRSFGGSLDLFSVDDSNRPLRIKQRLYPEFNSFSFFEVSPVSFHQVSEVLVEDVSRLSINGWFHGEPIQYPPRPILKSSIFILPGEIEEHVIYGWINPLYLDRSTQAEVRKEFQKKSEIQLSDFLKRKKYDQLTEALQSSDMVWKWSGPPNKRHVEVAVRKRVSSVVEEYLSLMESDAMFVVLSQLTGLELHHLAPEDVSSSSEEESESESETDGGSCSLEGERNARVSRVKSFCPKEENEDGGSLRRNNHQKGELSCDTNKAKRKGGGRERGKKKRKQEISERGAANSQSGEEERSVGGLLDVGWENDDGEQALPPMAAFRVKDSKTRGEVSSEVRRWRWGAYSLMRDDDLEANQSFLLDAMLFCNGSPAWDIELGGGTVYVAKGEQEELLTVLPVPNSMALVYRDKETFRFTKHINAKSKKLGQKSTLHEVFCEYREIK